MGTDHFGRPCPPDRIPPATNGRSPSKRRSYTLWAPKHTVYRSFTSARMTGMEGLRNCRFMDLPGRLSVEVNKLQFHPDTRRRCYRHFGTISSPKLRWNLYWNLFCLDRCKKKGATQLCVTPWFYVAVPAGYSIQGMSPLPQHRCFGVNCIYA